MKILVTNDDGIYAEGIILLCRQLAKRHEVVAVAPDRERSASSSCLSLGQPLRKKSVTISEYAGMEAYSVTGTPVDCVKMGLHHIAPDADLVISGINMGSNLGMDITYSGTVGAALDACMEGLPAIAFSQFHRMGGPDMPALLETAAALSAEIVDSIDTKQLDGYIYNFNFPSVPREQIRGVKVCPQGIMSYDEPLRRETDHYGREHYWLSGRPVPNEHNEAHGTDVKWIMEDYITLTPLQWNLTARDAMEPAKCNIEKIKLQNG